MSVAAALAAATFSAPVDAQSGSRLSLAERVQRLEQQAQGGHGAQSNLELLNRIQELQTEIQALRGLIEQQAFEIEGLKRRQREQYIDLDTRIGRIEGRAPEVSGEAPMDVEPRLPGQLTMEAPEIRPDIDADIRSEPLTAPDQAPAQIMADPADERRAYDQAFQALKDGRYAESARRFQGFLEQFPDGQFADNAQYWLGESYYVTQNYRVALDTFRQLIDRFPRSAKVSDALLKIGYCHYELREWEDAERVLNQVVERYPDTTVARLAQGRLRALRLETRQ
ncbi:MAG TPA: tol-pal system protein YbgF [Xanthomonadaceae bacterium]|nr:tol-pal system protein YbgF [Xanthomonadaceae bacterium]